MTLLSLSPSSSSYALSSTVPGAPFSFIWNICMPKKWWTRLKFPSDTFGCGENERQSYEILDDSCCIVLVHWLMVLTESVKWNFKWRWLKVSSLNPLFKWLKPKIKPSLDCPCGCQRNHCPHRSFIILFPGQNVTVCLICIAHSQNIITKCFPAEMSPASLGDDISLTF